MSDGLSTATIRAWAVEFGLNVPSRGTLPASIVEAYNQAHGIIPASDPQEFEEDPGPAEPVWTVQVTAPTDEHAQAITDAICQLIGAVRTAERHHVMTALEELE